MVDYILKKYYMVVSLSMFGYMFYDNLDDAILGASRLKALGYPATIKRNPNPDKVKI
jgi:hypothetical protein